MAILHAFLGIPVPNRAVNKAEERQVLNRPRNEEKANELCIQP